MKYIKLCDSSFIRFFDEHGYIVNQLTKKDLVVNEAGALFLRQLSKKTKKIDDLIIEVQKQFETEYKELVREDFIELMNELESENFIIIANSTKEILDKEPHFTYSAEIPKTHFKYSAGKELEIEDTTSFFDKNLNKNPQLFNLEIEVTSKCNEKCIHCYIPNENKKVNNHISFELFKSALDQAKDLNTLTVTLSGGELFLHPQIIEILEYTRMKDFKISILSNLTILNDSIIKTLKKISPSLIQVSLYSMIPEEHDYITQLPGSFKKTKASIERLIKENIPLQISCPVMNANKKSYKDVMIYANSIKVKSLTDFIMMGRSDLTQDNLSERIPLEDVRLLLNEMIDVDKDFIKSIEQKQEISEKVDANMRKDLQLCGAGIDSICLSAKGDLYPCPGWSDYKVGNLNEINLKQIWQNSEKLKKLRKITLKNFPKCIECSSIDFCAMCLVRNYNENNGDMFAINKHYCDVAEINKNLVMDYLSKNNVNG